MLVFIGVPCMILNFIHTRELLQGAGRVYGAVGAVIAILGAVILAGDRWSRRWSIHPSRMGPVAS